MQTSWLPHFAIAEPHRVGTFVPGHDEGVRVARSLEIFVCGSAALQLRSDVDWTASRCWEALALWVYFSEVILTSLIFARFCGFRQTTGLCGGVVVSFSAFRFQVLFTFVGDIPCNS